MNFLPTEQGPYRSHREGGQRKEVGGHKMPENLCFGTYLDLDSIIIITNNFRHLTAIVP